MAEIDPPNLCLSTSECCIEVRPNFNPPDWCVEMGIDISGEGKERRKQKPLGGSFMCRSLFVKTSWEQDYILLGGVCVLWSSLQPVWVLVGYLLGSFISTAGGVVEEWYHHSAEWVCSVCRGPCSCWGSRNSPGVQPRDGQHSLVSFLLRRYSCLFAFCRVEMQSLGHCGCSCEHLLWSQCQAQQWWAGLPAAVRGESWWGNKWVVKWGGWTGRWEHDLEEGPTGEGSKRRENCMQLWRLIRTWHQWKESWKQAGMFVG